MAALKGVVLGTTSDDSVFRVEMILLGQARVLIFYFSQQVQCKLVAHRKQAEDKLAGLSVVNKRAERAGLSDVWNSAITSETMKKLSFSTNLESAEERKLAEDFMSDLKTPYRRQKKKNSFEKVPNLGTSLHDQVCKDFCFAAFLA